MNSLLQFWDLLLHLVFPIWRSTCLKRAAIAGIYGYCPRHNRLDDFHKVSMSAARQYGLVGREVDLLLRRLGVRIWLAYSHLSDLERNCLMSDVIHCKEDTPDEFMNVIVPWILERLSSAAGTGLFEYTEQNIQDELVLAVREHLAHRYHIEVAKTKVIGVLKA